MLLMIRRDLRVLFAKEESVGKEIKRKKNEFEHLMLSEKNNEFNYLKTTSLWIIKVALRKKKSSKCGLRFCVQVF